jgi:hypothetical protein
MLLSARIENDLPFRTLLLYLDIPPGSGPVALSNVFNASRCVTENGDSMRQLPGRRRVARDARIEYHDYLIVPLYNGN